MPPNSIVQIYTHTRCALTYHDVYSLSQDTFVQTSEDAECFRHSFSAIYLLPTHEMISAVIDYLPANTDESTNATE